MRRMMRTIVAPLVAAALVLAGGIALLNTTGTRAQQVGEPIGIQVRQAQPTPTEQPEANEVPEADEAAAQAELAKQATITEQQARATVLAANPGATVVEVELDDEDGTVVYDVELSNGVDVEVNAQTGAITSTEQAEGDDEHEDAEGAEGPEDSEAPEIPAQP